MRGARVIVAGMAALGLVSAGTAEAEIGGRGMGVAGGLATGAVQGVAGDVSALAKVCAVAEMRAAGADLRIDGVASGDAGAADGGRSGAMMRDGLTADGAMMPGFAETGGVAFMVPSCEAVGVENATVPADASRMAEAGGSGCGEAAMSCGYGAASAERAAGTVMAEAGVATVGARQQADGVEQETPRGVIRFEKALYDFGKIQEADGAVSYEFVFTNEGKAPLVIARIETSCACTKAAFSKKPVPPGKEGRIKVTYDPKKQAGTFYKAIQVFSDSADPRLIVTIRGEVVPDRKK